MIPAWLQAVLLGIVQGLTEFIPVSSSGHLVLVPYLLGWEDRGLAFDVMLHLGTLGAVLIYFRREFWAIASGVLGLDRSATGRIYRRVGLLIIPASVPIALVGLLLEDQVAEVFESPLATVGFLVVTAGLLTGAEAGRPRPARRARRGPPPPPPPPGPVSGSGRAPGGPAGRTRRRWTRTSRCRSARTPPTRRAATSPA